MPLNSYRRRGRDQQIARNGVTPGSGLLIIRPIAHAGSKSMHMLNIVYSSTATKEFSRDDLAKLLERARTKNDQLGITGLLLYKRGSFMQALEGEEATVRALYTTIRADPRHRQIVTLVDIPVAQARFSNWKMGFENLDDVQLNAAGEQSHINLPPRVEFPWRGSVAMQFLTAFWGSGETPPTHQ